MSEEAPWGISWGIKVGKDSVRLMIAAVRSLEKKGEIGPISVYLDPETSREFLALAFNEMAIRSNIEYLLSGSKLSHKADFLKAFILGRKRLRLEAKEWEPVITEG